MLEALKALDARHGDAPAQSVAPTASAKPKVQAAPKAVPSERATRAPSEVPIAPPRQVPGTTGCAACILPTVLELSDAYLELAVALAEQNASNYCNVLLFVSPEPIDDRHFSLTRLAQAVALQSPGQVLLVDGDLRGRSLSKAVELSGAGLGDVMSGRANWPDVICPTNMACVDIVGAGTRHVPTLERPDFGWNALRPQYRAVLIGVATGNQPETAWLAARCDAVYFVIRRAHTRRQTATTATNALRACGASVLGCIVAED